MVFIVQIYQRKEENYVKVNSELERKFKRYFVLKNYDQNWSIRTLFYFQSEYIKESLPIYGRNRKGYILGSFFSGR